MKVKELIEALSQFDGDTLVVLQKDSEGNGYSPLAGADDEALYLPENTWSGEVYSEQDIEELELEDEPVVPCVVLFPMN